MFLQIAKYNYVHMKVHLLTHTLSVYGSHLRGGTTEVLALNAVDNSESKVIV